MDRARRWIPFAPMIVLSVIAMVSIATMTPAIPAPIPASTVTVLQWNVCGNRLGCPSSAEPERIVAAVVERVTATGADVALLQEVCETQAVAIEETLEHETGQEWTVRFTPILVKEGDDPAKAAVKRCHVGGDYGLATVLPGENTWWDVRHLPSPDGREWRVAMCATIPSVWVKVCNTHLSSPPEDDGDEFRVRQVAAYQDFVLPSKYRLIVGGDLNLSPDDGDGAAPLYDVFVECAQADVDAPRVGPATYHGEDVDKKIDYLFTDVGNRHECHGTGPVDVSDHSPIWMTVDLPETPRV